MTPRSHVPSTLVSDAEAEGSGNDIYFLFVSQTPPPSLPRGRRQPANDVTTSFLTHRELIATPRYKQSSMSYDYNPYYLHQHPFYTTSVLSIYGNRVLLTSVTYHHRSYCSHSEFAERFAAQAVMFRRYRVASSGEYPFR